MKIDKEIVESPKGDITLITITNASGASVTLSTFGAGIVSVLVPDRKGKLDDVTLGYANAADYLYDGPCAGKIPGRFANRIAKGKFTLEGKEYQLAINNGPNHLHGGPDGFQNRIWNFEIVGDNTVVFSRISPDGEEGYPATLNVTATYVWTEDNKLKLNLSAKSDGTTIVNLTNHAYWNLNGHNSGSIFNQELMLNCTRYVPTDDTSIPTGELAPVENTPMDFRAPKPIGKDIKEDFTALKYGKGYDHSWVIDNYTPGVMQEIATLYSPETGRKLTVSTTQPAAQIYTGNWLAGSPINKSGRSYNDYDGVAIECQHLPDTPNEPAFPTCVLHKNEIFEENIEFAFSVVK